MERQKNVNYKKALKYYEEGEIDKALSSLEKSISENLKNSGALNLKAILLYIKGELDEAISCFKINYEYNNDLIAKEYIKDIEGDRERLVLYNKAIKEINSLNIDEAIKLLNVCIESDFNSIKVNVALGMCYLRKGMYNESFGYTERALKLDSNNKTAKEIMADLKKYGNIKESNTGHSYKGLVCIVLCVFLCGGVILFKYFNKDNAQNTVADNISLEIPDEEAESNKEETVVEENTTEESNTEEVSAENKTEVDKNTKETVNTDKLKEYIKNKDFENIVAFINENNSDELKQDATYIEGINLLKEEGPYYFYNKGMDEYSIEEFEKSKESFSIAYTYGKEYYLYSQIVYLNGAVRDKLGDSSSMEYYEEYLTTDSQIPGYTQESAYRLALFYKDSNIEKSRQYAKILKDNYPDSIYYNDIIRGII